MDSLYLDLKKTLFWLSYFCDEDVNIFHIEMEFEGCNWIPLDYLDQVLSKESLKNLTNKIHPLTQHQIESQNEYSI